MTLEEKETIDGIELCRANPGCVVRELNATAGQKGSASLKVRNMEASSFALAKL